VLKANIGTVVIKMFSVHLQDANRVKLMEINDKNTIKKRLLRHDCSDQDTDLTNRGLI
jgi:hypothetical protein